MGAKIRQTELLTKAQIEGQSKRDGEGREAGLQEQVLTPKTRTPEVSTLTLARQ